MSLFDQKPTTESINAMVEHLRDVWRETHDRWSRADTFYERTFQLWDPKLIRPIVHPAKAKSIVDTAVDQMMGHEPTFERFPRNVQSKDAADSGEKALKSMYTQMGLLEAELTLETVKKNLILYGYAVLEDSIDSVDLAFHHQEEPHREPREKEESFKRRMALFEHKKKTLMPFRNKAPHPADILIDPSHKNPRIAIKVGKWFSGDLVELTDNRFDDDGNVMRGEAERFDTRHNKDGTENPFELVDCVEYWTESWHALMVTGGMNPSSSLFNRLLQRATEPQMLILEPNTWGFVPYSHAFAGFGHQPTNATERGPHKLAEGMLDSIQDDLIMDAQRTAGKHNALMEATFAKRGTRMDPAEVENQESSSDTIEMANRGDLWYLEQPTLPAHLENFGIENNKDIEEATFVRGVGGIRDTGVNTVGQQAILNTAGHRKFIKITQQVNHLYSNSASHVLQWVDILDLDLLVEGNPINRTMVDGDYSVKVEHKVVEPVLQLQERQQALTEYQAGVMDLETLWSISGQSDTSGARERLWDDLVYADPVIQKAFIEQRAKKLGLDKLLSEEPDILTESANQTTPTSTILGPDGQPLQSTLGSDALRAPLDSRTFKPAQSGQNLAG